MMAVKLLMEDLMKVLFKLASRALAATALIMSLSFFIGLIYLEMHLPSVETLRDIKLQVPLKVLSRDGKLMAEFGEKRRIPVKIQEVPPLLIKALLATEDRRFFEHSGVDARGIARAAVNLITKASREQGGSTITMQVARNFFLTRKKTFLRKINEILLALKIEKELSKDEILELYLNVIYLGKRAYGVAAAAEVYYGLPLQNLNLAQMAMIAGLPQAPSAINPLQAPQAALKRRKHVLDRMLNYQFINEDQHHEAINTPITAVYHARVTELDAPFVAEMVRQELVQRYGEDVYASGFEVYTSIDSEQQVAANKAVRRATTEYDRRQGYRPLNIKLPLSEQTNPEETLKHWHQALKTYPHYGELQPAVVTAVNPSSVWIYTKSGHYGQIALKDMAWAKHSQNPGAVAFKASELLQSRELIYVERLRDQAYRLSQVPKVEAALVAVNPQNGSLSALVGGFDYDLSHFNRVTQAERQVGSNFKPFIYAAALEEGYNLASVVNDAPLVHYDPVSGPWRPQNDKNRFFGPTRLRASLARSQNLVAVRLLLSIGIPKMLKYADNFGFNTAKLPPYPSLALGSGTTSPIELVSAYASLANGGFRVKPYLIERIQDEQGQLLEQHHGLKAAPKGWAPDETAYAPRAISVQTAYLITTALQDAIRSGTGRRALSLGRHDLAGKTGTTNDKLDAWYSGYNPQLVATAWMGFDEPRSLKEYGSQAALPIWMYFMEEALKSKADLPLPQPPGIISVRIDPLTGLLARSGQKDAIYEYFLEGTEPERTAPQALEVLDAEPGTLDAPVEPLF